MPERFDLTYIGADGEKHRPIMLHRVIFGSIERFIGILIEHTSGAFPAWCAPIQIALLPISEKHEAFGEKLMEQLKSSGARVGWMSPDDTLGKRIRKAQTHKIPFSVIIGDEEMESGELTIRRYGEQKDEKINVENLLKNLEVK